MYSSRESFADRYGKQAIWLNLGWPVKPDVQKRDGHEVIVEGIFDAAAKGHMGMFAGSLSNIDAFRSSSTSGSLLRLMNAICGYRRYTSQAHREQPMKNRTVLNGFLAIVIVLVTGAACSSSYGTKLEFNGHELFYTDKVTEADAKKLGDYLVKGGFFKGDALRVQLDKAGATYQFRMPMRPGTQNDLELRRDLRRLTNLISADVFNGAATEIHTCDDQLEACKVINLY